MSGVASYGSDSSARRVAEPTKRSGRTHFQRDRARVLHSAGLRRLAATTQVMLAFESDFPRTRLTHSLECAQIGRELGAALGCDPDLVETACLAHDLGHPPFGHNGERALDAAAAACGGFEGNAQSFRVLTRLEAKVVGPDGRSAGLNLTRAALDAATKYPWTRREGTSKFGVYDDDLEVLDWVRDGVEGEARPLESHVMDWADDVAYSVHDVEDGLHSGLIPLAALDDDAELDSLFRLCHQRYAADSSVDELAAALGRLRALPMWPKAFDGSHAGLVALKALTSHLIGRFCSGAELATRAEFGAGPLHRYDAFLVVPKDVRDECAVLKAVAARYVMARDGADELLAEQRRVVTRLVETLVEAPQELSPPYRAMHDEADDDAARLRAVVDQVASLTDHSALSWHQRLCG